MFLLALPLVFPSPTSAQDLFTDGFETGEITDKWTYLSGSWNRELFDGSTWARVASGAASDNEIQAGNSTWIDYKFNLDIFKIEGEDINLFFRIQSPRYLNLPGHNLPVSYGLHLKHNRIALQKFTESTGSELQVVTNDVPFLNSTLKHLTINLVGNNIKVFIDSSINPTIDYTDNDEPFLNGGIAIGSITGSAAQNVRFDNVVVTELPDEEEEPLPILTVPDLKQYSLPWKNKTYDHKNASIEKFGCALTAASMVLQYHGHNITPDVLNNWLKNQPDGYLKNGLVNWLAISRYTKENYSPSSRTLEYKRLDPTNENLDNELNNDRPAILKEPGHFVVATGKTIDGYLINDPGYSDRTDLVPYENSFLKINSYTPTDSDLSYMMFVTDPDINLELLNSSGSAILVDSYIEDPITNLLNPDKKSGNPVKIYLFEKPETGKYTLKATGQKGKYNLESYLYNLDGKVVKNKYEGRLKGDDVDTFNINYENRKKKSNFWYWHKFFSEFFENYPQYD